MLKKGINSLCFFVLFFFLSCENNEKKNKNEITIEINNSENANKFVANNFKNYESIYSTINDSINLYVDSLLEGFLGEYLWEWRIDSLIIINSDKTKLATTLNISIGACKECLTDDVIGLLGKKINGKWYFFKGIGNLTVPRDMFSKDAMHPLSFYELSQIARENMLSGAVIEKNGKLIIDDKWVDRHFYNNGFAQRGWDEIKDKPKYDSVHWFYIMDKWKHKIDTNEYKPLQRKQFKKVNS